MRSSIWLITPSRYSLVLNEVLLWNVCFLKRKHQFLFLHHHQQVNFFQKSRTYRYLLWKQGILLLKFFYKVIWNLWKNPKDILCQPLFLLYFCSKPVNALRMQFLSFQKRYFWGDAYSDDFQSFHCHWTLIYKPSSDVSLNIHSCVLFYVFLIFLYSSSDNCNTDIFLVFSNSVLLEYASWKVMVLWFLGCRIKRAEALFVTYDLWKWLPTVSRVSPRHFWVLVKIWEPQGHQLEVISISHMSQIMLRLFLSGNLRTKAP